LDRQRIDKWLWHARMLRTRSAAAALVAAGHVRINGRRVTAASQLVHAGDVVTLALDRSARLIEVAGFGERRGGAGAARALYRDMTTSSGSEASAAGKTSPMLGPRVRKGNRTASL
jgi:ribosome-associated heat shock protein Hsp15